MTDPRISGQLKALAEDYELRAEKAAHADAVDALAGRLPVLAVAMARQTRLGPEIADRRTNTWLEQRTS
jgi:hypothetical protein